jgi:predicted MPP superfamily phosphohydrolase
MRRFSLLGLIIMLLVLGALEYYTYTAMKFAVRSVKQPWRQYLMIGYVVLTVLWFAALFSFPMLRTASISKGLRNFLVAFSMGFLLMKLLIALVLLIDDARRVIFWVLSKFYHPEQRPALVESGMTRSDFLARMALLFGGTLFGGMVYGMTNRYNYTVRLHKLRFPNLPEAFRGLRVVQISDIHTGSLNDRAAVGRGIQKILDLKPDLIVFTGDLVNNTSDEADEFLPELSKLSAPLGVYSILGNHDYGDYVSWETPEAKAANLERLKDLHRQMGWNLLLDEHVVLERGGERIGLLGVQNTSFRNNFHSYGDLAKAYAGSEPLPFRILLSHDPSHWDGEVNARYRDIDLTLSGHTHGFQFGVEIPWIKWSPVQYIYKQWAGLYQSGEQYLYVNRGFGFLGYPGRVGIMPEITLLELA